MKDLSIVLSRQSCTFVKSALRGFLAILFSVCLSVGASPKSNKRDFMPLSELKPKDAVMVSTTKGSDPGRVTAIVLLAGVEPILTAAPNATRDIMSGWNLGGEGGEGNQ